MSRPEPRRSSLSTRHPAAPAAPQETAPEAPAQQGAEGDSAGRAKARRTRHKVSFYQDPEDTARMRGAILHTMPHEGARTLSEFIHRAVMAEVQRLESVYNDGNPFPPLDAGELPQGRPMGG